MLDKLEIHSIKKHNVCILYKPILDEINYEKQALPFEIPKNCLVLPNDKNSDPFEWADFCKKKFIKTNPYVLIPGKKFDLYGTRHGRGYGWYDRFLSKIPKNWPRIGVADISKIHPKKLIKKSWDEPVDWIMIFNFSNASWKFHETHARQKQKL